MVTLTLFERLSYTGHQTVTPACGRVRYRAGGLLPRFPKQHVRNRLRPHAPQVAGPPIFGAPQDNAPSKLGAQLGLTGKGELDSLDDRYRQRAACDLGE